MLMFAAKALLIKRLRVPAITDSQCCFDEAEVMPFMVIDLKTIYANAGSSVVFSIFGAVVTTKNSNKTSFTFLNVLRTEWPFHFSERILQFFELAF